MKLSQSKGRIAVVLFLVFTLPLNLVAQVMTSTSYQLRFDSGNAGGGLATSTSYQMEDTVGEIATGRSGSASSNWFDASWDHRVKITVNSSEVTSTLTNFPLYVDLSHLPGDFFTHVASDGADIRLVEGDGTTETPFEVVSLDTVAMTGELHLKIDSLSSVSDTDFYIYYGNATATAYAATSTYGRNNVWTNNYVAVWHLNEDPGTAGSGGIIDSTGNGHDGTDNGGMTTGDLVSGRVGNAISFDGLNDYIEVADANEFSPSVNDLTIAAWMNIATTTSAAGQGACGAAGEYFLTKGTTSNWEWGLENDSNTRLCYTNWQVTGADHVSLEEPRGMNDGLWRHVVGSIDYLNEALLFLDGEQVDSSTSFASTMTNTTAPVRIGARGDGNYFEGPVDEVRISSVVRSSDWVYMEFFNQKYPRVLYTVHEEEDQFGTYVLGAGFQQMNEGFVSATVVNDAILRPGIGVVTSNSVASETIRVRSDSPAGYNLYIKTTQSPALQHLSTAGNFVDYTPSTPGTPENWSVDSGQSQFGYSVYDSAGGDVADGTWGTADDCGSTVTGEPDAPGGSEQLYDGLSTSTNLVAQRSVRTSESGSEVTFCFAAGTNGGVVESGEYQAPITVTIIAL